jgi:hypothetical protein
MMRWLKRLLVIAAVALSLCFIAGCQPGRTQPEEVTIEAAPPPTDEGFAEATLTVFFSQLQAGDYDLAADLYGGSYDVLTNFNPDVDPTDRATLWRNGCSINGLNCLKTRTVTLTERPSVDEYVYAVEFSTREGDLFVLGPCCGVTETEQPPVSRFLIRVARGDDGRFGVMDLPPYTP